MVDTRGEAVVVRDISHHTGSQLRPATKGRLLDRRPRSWTTPTRNGTVIIRRLDLAVSLWL
jgi:hypothetical protein